MSLPILHFARLTWPANWREIYGREAPMIVELGFGGGDNLLALAGENPSSNVLGVEISLPSLRRGARKIAALKLANARVVQGDSRTVLWLLFPAQSISRVVINFPDPWPKAGHHHRRVVNKPFLDLLATRMLPGAHLEIATDHQEYQEVIEACLAESNYFESRTDRSYLVSVENRRQTKYERIALSEGRIPHYYFWRRNQVVAPDDFPIPEETVVPHVILLPSLSFDDFGQRFEPFHIQDESIHIKYLNMFRSVDGEMLLSEVYVSEEPYRQRIGLSIRRRQEGDCVVSLYEMGFSRPTPGIHLAVKYLVNWMQQQDPDLKIINSTLVRDLEPD
jgi:tRNA (guanine-N7-)-methyltransferase